MELLGRFYRGCEYRTINKYLNDIYYAMLSVIF